MVLVVNMSIVLVFAVSKRTKEFRMVSELIKLFSTLIKSLLMGAVSVCSDGDMLVDSK